MADLDWMHVAIGTRDALDALGYSVGPRCLPGEPEFCGGSFAEHAAAHLAAIKAVADHQLSHMRPPTGLIESVYLSVNSDLASHSGCNVPRVVW